MVTPQLLDYLYLKMPGTEPVTLTTRRGANNDTTSTVSISHAWMRDITHDDIVKGLVTSAKEAMTWNIPNVLLAGSEIETGDTITDANNVAWTVMSISRVRLRTHWRCICRRAK
ncbi:hypothetical protein Pan153_61070 [Gimesia panareensis]|uniref:Uncharacterized protein n=1 Tax=Gimesia panareensis TaxID=2527978 RepID=A0A517QFQ7_9PLAN|nr:hypothetical protein [Gimesia panareensis]QDT30478.1 hypothetical protein Enr10x_58440 [Gimesia panareensis]QDV21419.1 hypothetical protein Pan153_61070 [Gimesia panareensis]